MGQFTPGVYAPGHFRHGLPEVNLSFGGKRWGGITIAAFWRDLIPNSVLYYKCRNAVISGGLYLSDRYGIGGRGEMV